MGINKELTPKKIVEELNKYIISQDEAKKNVAISLRNRDSYIFFSFILWNYILI